VREACRLGDGRYAVNPLYFGSSDRPLYGVYHAPKARMGRRTGVVLCYPFGQEYMRAHRAFRQLSLQLAKAGFHVFRFDYYGTGDSSGDGDDFCLAQAAVDAGQAIEELQDMADVDTVALFGLRLGGTVAAQVAAQHDAVTHLVLWDAIGDGAAYLQELQAEAKVPLASGGRGGDAAPTAFGVMGYPVPPAVQGELAGLQFGKVAQSTSVRTLVVSDSDTAEAGALAAWCRGNGWVTDTLVAPLPGKWGEVDNWGSAMIPQDAIQAIVSWMSNEVA
jgi:pimeloyl-ACP methyl ester carboxylesterase